MSSTSRLLALCCFLGLSSCGIFPETRQAQSVGPWSLPDLERVPESRWGTRQGSVQEVYFRGEPFNGKSTEVFAYLARPEKNPSSPIRWPAMVLVHGGGGKAFSAWAEHWAQRGYVAIAMDLSGNGPAGRLPNGGPDQADAVKFRNFTESEAREMWTYHAVAAVMRAHSLLRSLPEVDPDRTGITGISWGGYLTCIVAGVDQRFKVAVPVYGCGFLGDNSVWKDGSLARLSPEARTLWLQLFDPSAYLGRVRHPILFVNGTTDFAYPLDSYQKSYRLVPDRWRQISVAVDRKHGHIWTFPEVDLFVDSVLRREPSLIRFGPPLVRANQIEARLDRTNGCKAGLLCYTQDEGAWQKRKWETRPARLEGHRIVAELPPARPLVAFLAVDDDRGAHVSSEHIEISAR